MPNPQKSSKIPFLLAALVFIVLAFYAYSNYNTVTYGGQKYKTVKIGEQTWMAENLNYEAEGSVCYDNNPDNCAKYGRLYDWEAAIKVCPEGWHLPSIEEWDKLLRFVDSEDKVYRYVGGDTSSAGPYENRRAGKYLKAVSGWNSYKGYDGNGNGTDKYGFSALPGGRGF
jgi:uncharacterized protein (TIGR02145 family)